jgi:hypothetical protein
MNRQARCPGCVSGRDDEHDFGPTCELDWTVPQVPLRVRMGAPMDEPTWPHPDSPDWKDPKDGPKVLISANWSEANWSEGVDWKAALDNLSKAADPLWSKQYMGTWSDLDIPEPQQNMGESRRILEFRREFPSSKLKPVVWPVVPMPSPMCQVSKCTQLARYICTDDQAEWYSCREHAQRVKQVRPIDPAMVERPVVTRRRCESGSDSGEGRCMEDATHICKNRDGIEWFACPKHTTGSEVSRPMQSWWNEK